MVRPPGSYPRGRVSVEEYDELGAACTQASMEALLGTPEFKRWLVSNAARLRVVPPVHAEAEDDVEDEEGEEDDLDGDAQGSGGEDDDGSRTPSSSGACGGGGGFFSNLVSGGGGRR